MTSRWRWIVVVTVATALDLVARLVTSFDLSRVMRVEAVLFPLTAIVLALLRRSEPRTHGWPNGIRLGLVWLFGLGAVRPLLWTLGASLMVANLATLVVALVGILVWALTRRRRPDSTRPPSDSSARAA